MSEVKYLGRMINAKGYPRKEVRKRISECMCIMKKLDCFWKHTNNPTKWKLMTYNAIITTKLMYGLESAQLNESIKKYLDVVQLTCLRKIPTLQHTYPDRENTNEKLYAEAEKEMNIGDTGKYKTLMKLSEYYDTRRMKTLTQIIHHKDTDDPRTTITFDKHTLEINEYDKKEEEDQNLPGGYAMDDLWLTYQKSNEAHRYTPMNLDNPDHIEIIKQTAKHLFEEQQKKKKKKKNEKNNNSDTDNTNNAINTANISTTQQNTGIPESETNRLNNDANTNFIYSHTITNIQETHNTTHATDNEEHSQESDAKENKEPTLFKQALQRHKDYNKIIIKQQFAIT